MLRRLYTNIRLIIGRYLRENMLKIIIILVLILFGTSIYNMILNYNTEVRPIVTKDMETPVISNQKFPSRIQEEGLKKINQFLNYVKEDKIDLAAEMLTEDAKYYSFKNKKEAIGYIIEVYKDKKYDIKPYAKVGNDYIYQVKVFEDILETGLTNTIYSFTDTKMIIKNENGKIGLNIRGYIGKYKSSGFYEDNNLKVNIKGKNVWVEHEDYLLEITNRTNNYLVLKDKSNNTALAASLEVGNSNRKLIDEENIILKPLETRNILLRFPKMYFADKDATAINLDSIRVIKDYNEISNSNLSDEKLKQKNISNTLAEFKIRIEIEK
ncbi:MAG: hypothetical protein HG454_004760 [Clostridiales bacterium]|jgi:hypothetical protein|nr:hypothetical protein [Clostridiales bacterium]